MSEIELLLAAHVRQLAIDLRSSAKAAYFASIFDEISENERAGRLAQWDSDHPVELYLYQAADQIEWAAQLLANREPRSEP